VESLRCTRSKPTGAAGLNVEGVVYLLELAPLVSGRQQIPFLPATASIASFGVRWRHLRATVRSFALALQLVRRETGKE
jgi:hypothetical protein